MMKNAPVKVKNNILMNLEKHFVFLKFYGSKSPWANFMPIIQLYWAKNETVRATKQIVIAI